VPQCGVAVIEADLSGDVGVGQVTVEAVDVVCAAAAVASGTGRGQRVWRGGVRAIMAAIPCGRVNVAEW